MNTRIRKAATAAALVASTAGGAGAVVALTASPASAATAVSVCVGKAQTDGVRYVGYPITLWQSDSAGNRVHLLRSGQTGSNGCGTFFNTPSGIFLRAAARCGQFNYSSPGWASPGAYGATLGTIKVPC